MFSDAGSIVIDIIDGGAIQTDVKMQHVGWVERPYRETQQI
jgi:hypothetical protein